MVDGGPWDNATINDTLHLITPNSDEVLLMTGYFPSPTAAGILIVSRGIEGLKDIAALGNLSTESPTVLTFATSGYTNCQRTDIGKPVKSNGNPLELTVLIAYDNNIRKWWLSRPHNISVDDVLTIDGGQGTGTRDDRPGFTNTGGGAIMIGKGYEDYNDPPRICLTNGDTLYITAGSSVPNGADAVTANLKVKDFTATGSVTVNGNLIANEGITIGSGTIYWQTATNPDVLEMDCGLIVDGELNVAGVSVNGALGVTGQITSSIATGTAPLNVTSTTICPNLNADMLDGHHSGDFLTSISFNQPSIDATFKSLTITDGTHHAGMTVHNYTGEYAIEFSDLGLVVDGSLGVGGGLQVTGDIGATGNSTVNMYRWSNASGSIGQGTPSDGTLAGLYAPACGMWHAGSATYGACVFLSDEWDYSPMFTWYGSRFGVRKMSLDSSGNLAVSGTVTGTVIKSSGAISGLIFPDRSTATNFQWYATGNVAYLHNGTSNILGISVNGDFYATSLHSDGAIFATSSYVHASTLYSTNETIIGHGTYDVHLKAEASNVLSVKDNSGTQCYLECGYVKTGGLTALVSYIYTFNDMIPTSAGTLKVGNHASNYYQEGAFWDSYGHTGHAFAAFDDLALVKQWGEEVPEVPDDYDDSKKKPSKKNDPFRILKGSSEEEEGDGELFNLGKMTSFSLGCAKALAKKQDEQDEITSVLLSRIEILENQLRSSQTQA